SASTRNDARSTYGRPSRSARAWACASPSTAATRAPPATVDLLAIARPLALHLRHQAEDRQIDREQDGHDDPSHDHEDDRLDERDDARETRVDLFVVELRDRREHFFERAGGLADLHHLDRQVGEELRVLERLPELAAFPHARHDVADATREKSVA